MKKKLYIDGMCCCKCPGKVESGLEIVEGIKSVQVNKDDSTAVIELDKDLDILTLENAVKASGHYNLIKVENI